MSHLRPQSGRGTFRLVLLLVVLGVVAYLAWGFLHQPTGSQVSVSPADASSAVSKVDSFAQAAAQAQRTGKPVSVVQTFSDAELSSLATQAAQNQGLPLRQISLHSTGSGTIQGQAQADVAGQSVPVTLEGVPVIDGDRVALHLNSVQVGSIPLPGPISDQLTQSIRTPLELGQPITGFQGLKVSVSDGQLTVSGTATPA
jgi:hypothetical protein